jgi:glycosyltransferase involved in cell wall biosynthesis
MAASRPVVATDVGGAREAVAHGETGYLVRPGDDEAMAAHIVSLLRSPEQARWMGIRGRRVIEEQYSGEVLLARTHDLYQRLLNRVPPARLGVFSGAGRERASSADY